MDVETVNGVRFEQWSPAEVKAAFDRNEVILIDVRTPQEYGFEHIIGALLAPMSYFRPEALPTQDGKQIILHCGSGIRSRKVAEACVAAGFDRIAHMTGGFAAWKQAGLPYVAINPATGAPHILPEA